MFCKKCGSALNDGAQFCHHCGQDQTVILEQTPVTEENVIVEENDAEKEAFAGSVFKFGLMGAIFSCTGLCSLLGIIMSAIGLSKAGKFRQAYQTIKGRALAGKILSIVGLAYGIFFTVFFALYFFVIIMAVLAEMGGSF